MKMCDEELVISGISGRFPLASSVDEFAENLLNGVDMVTEDDKRWPPGLYGLPRRHGKLDDIDKFDAQFFGVSGTQANMMDAQIRLMLEVAYEAVSDSGTPAATIRGKKIGVFVTSTANETKDALIAETDPATKYCLLGTAGTMLANRISFSLNLTGPSIAVDTACASSLSAIDQAVLAMRTGQCEAAIVGGVHLTLNPSTSLHFNMMSMLSPEGKCKAFDATADGFVRSEACVSIFIQKITDAKRIYAKIIHIKSNVDGYKHEGLSFPSTEMQKKLISDTYEECNLSPLAVNYVEAHGTGTKAGDPVELNSIAAVYCPGRDQPLMVGSTKSNLGHTEFAAGLCSLVKVIISFERGNIPANLHLKTLNTNIESLVNGSIKPVTEMTQFDGGLVGINSFGMGGSNVHLIVQSHDRKTKSDSNAVIPTTHPRLVTVCGRNEKAIDSTFNFMRDNPSKITREFLSLINDLSKEQPDSGMTSRGFKLLGHTDAEFKVNQVARKRSIWFIMPGMGCQWTAMGRQLMLLPQFAQSIDEFALILKEKQIDLMHLLTSDNTTLLDNLINRLVMVAAVQGALIDLLHSLGVEADGFVGHSQGELVCGYACRCLNKRQFILSVYWRAKCCQLAQLSGQMMATVSLSVDECKKIMPIDVSIACFNSQQSLTLAGPVQSMRNLLDRLKSEGKFARELSSCGIAFHSPHVSSTKNTLLRELEREIPVPVKRPEKWVSSSVPEEYWSDTKSQFASATYFVNNFLNPVRFADAVKHIPNDAIVLEISAHPLFKAVLNQSLGTNISYISLMNKDEDDQMLHLFTSLGKLYTLGVNLNLEVLYPAVEYPVPRGTPSISSLMRWDHAQSWLVPKYPEYFNSSKAAGGIETTIDLSTDDYSYLAGHMIDGRVLFPATGYIMLAWQAFAQVSGEVLMNCPVHVSNIQLHTACVLSTNGPVIFSTQVLSSTGEFLITQAGDLVASGQITFLSQDEMNLSAATADEDTATFTKTDVYKELRVRGYDYQPSFQAIERSTFDASSALIKWTGKWISFADNMLQLFLVSSRDRSFNLPTKINSIKCDPTKLMTLETDSLVKVYCDSTCQEIYCDGLTINGLSMSPANRRNAQNSIESYIFVPHIEDNLECEELANYVTSCSTVASALLKKAKRNIEAESLACDDDISIKSLEALHLAVKDSDEKILLKSLLHLLFACDFDQHNFNQVVTAVEELHCHKMNTDLLEQSLLSERLLRPMIHLVTENSPRATLHILEVNHSATPLASSISFYARLDSKQVICSMVKNDRTNAHNEVDWKECSDLDLPQQDLVVCHHSIDINNERGRELFTHICSLVREGGFLLLCGRTNFTQVEQIILGRKNCRLALNALEQRAASIGFNIVAKKTNCTGASLVLLRKKKEQIVSQSKVEFIGINSTNFSWLPELKAAITDREANSESKNIWLTTTDPECSGLIGLVNCLRLEPGGEKIRCIMDKKINSIDESKPYAEKVLELDLAINVISDKNQHGTYCYLNVSPAKTMVLSEHAYIHPTTRADLTSMNWINHDRQVSSSVQHLDENQLIDIYYSSLNFKDLMLATGRIEAGVGPKQAMIGIELSGKMTTGSRVMGFVTGCGIATRCRKGNTFFWSVPYHWSLEQAATVPVAYSTAYYSLIVRGALQRGESVLIHSGAGGVGLAAIAVCLSMACEVFITVGSQAKKIYLLEEYPQLKKENIFSSRDLTFEQGVMQATNGRGVDLVLNSLTEEKLEASVRLVATHGRFVEIGKYDMMKDNTLAMSAFLKNISFIGVSLEALFLMDPSKSSERHKKVLKQLMNEGIANGTVKPLRSTVFTKEKAADAFLFMKKGEHIGKILIQMRQEEPVTVNRPEPLRVLAIAKTFFHPDKSYIIVGGLGGFGLELVHWMVSRGARNLILTSRSGVKNAFQEYSLDRLRQLGAKLVISRWDAGYSSQANKLVDEAIALGPVGGIFNLALVLRDKLLVNQTAESFTEVTHCKVTATIHLDSVSRVKCPQLDHFVVFSSIASGFGNAGQSNYALANSSMERICEERRKLNLPALAIQWGAIADVGVIADKITTDTLIRGTAPQRINSCISSLDQLLNIDAPVVTSCVRHVNDAHETGKTSSAPCNNDLVSIVCRIMGQNDPSSIPPDMSLLGLGVDSLMSFELKQILELEAADCLNRSQFNLSPYWLMNCC